MYKNASAAQALEPSHGSIYLSVAGSNLGLFQIFETECATVEEEECYTKYEEKCEPTYKVRRSFLI